MDTSYFVNEMPKSIPQGTADQRNLHPNWQTELKNQAAMCNLRFTKKLGYKTDLYVLFFHSGLMV